MPKPALERQSRQSELEPLLMRYREVRAQSERLCQPLTVEDFGVQSMADVSPPKWHLAHVSWFFEAFLLRPFLPGYRPLDERYDHLFNSYYQTHGTPFPRARRGLLSRPTVAEVYRYREHVDRAMAALLEGPPAEQQVEIVRRTELGLQHEQQHQELLLMDIKHILAQNPLLPAYRGDLGRDSAPAVPMRWLRYPGGIGHIGDADADFAFDCERPRHRVFVEAYQLASRPVSNAEYAEFIADGGYARSDWWLADGWTLIQQAGWRAPLYWSQEAGRWLEMTLGGQRELDPHAPVCHLSYYEAEAYAAWAGVRLPSEAEWELAAQDEPLVGNFVEQDRLQPMAAVAGSEGPAQLFGDVWEWTGSAYRPYPGFRALAGSLGEYNGKFMCGQMVLRGGCCATPQAHVRSSYRNFFYPAMRWQFSGLRLAREA
jgi:ergothioneine biosynthesis protein EgtB